MDGDLSRAIDALTAMQAAERGSAASDSIARAGGAPDGGALQSQATRGCGRPSIDVPCGAEVRAPPLTSGSRRAHDAHAAGQAHCNRAVLVGRHNAGLFLGHIEQRLLLCSRVLRSAIC